MRLGGRSRRRTGSTTATVEEKTTSEGKRTLADVKYRPRLPCAPSATCRPHHHSLSSSANHCQKPLTSQILAVHRLFVISIYGLNTPRSKNGESLFPKSQLLGVKAPCSTCRVWFKAARFSCLPTQKHHWSHLPMPSEVSLNYPMGKFIHIFRLLNTARTFDLVWPVWGCYFDISPPRHSPCFQQIHPLSIPACKWLRFIFRLLLFQKPGCHIYNSKTRRLRLGRHSYATPLVLAGFSL